MKKTIFLLLASIQIFGADTLKRPSDIFGFNPLNKQSLSTDSGGTKASIDAYSDGGGVLLINQPNAEQINNSATNSLVFKYGDEAKSNNVSLQQQVLSLSPNATLKEKSLAAFLNNIPASQNIQCNGLIVGSSCWTESGLAVANTAYNCPTGGTVSGSNCDGGSACAGGWTWNASAGNCQTGTSTKYMETRYGGVSGTSTAFPGSFNAISWDINGNFTAVPSAMWNGWAEYCGGIGDPYAWSASVGGSCYAARPVIVNNLQTAAPSCSVGFSNVSGTCIKPAVNLTTYSCSGFQNAGGALYNTLDPTKCFTPINPCPLGTNISNPDSKTSTAQCGRI